MAYDPVCGAIVDPDEDEALLSVYDGETYYFCSEDCQDQFEAAPERYARRTPPVTTT